MYGNGITVNAWMHRQCKAGLSSPRVYSLTWKDLKGATRRDGGVCRQVDVHHASHATYLKTIFNIIDSIV